MGWLLSTGTSIKCAPYSNRTFWWSLEELTPRPDTPPDRTALRSIPDLDDLSLGLGTKTSRSGINLRVVRSGGVSGLGVSSSTNLGVDPVTANQMTWKSDFQADRIYVG